MNIKNNKGFSLIEVLVTVGLIGILVGIAVPSYQGYRRSTVGMAMKADLGNGSKVYNAQYAVESTYCYPFSIVGLSTDRSKNPIYKKNGFYGFGDLVSGDCGSVGITEIQFKSSGSKRCVGGTGTDQTTCEANNGTWASDKGTEYEGDPSTCTLGSNSFKMGATSKVSKLDVFLQADETGRIIETLSKQIVNNLFDFKRAVVFWLPLFFFILNKWVFYG